MTVRSFTLAWALLKPGGQVKLHTSLAFAAYPNVRALVAVASTGNAAPIPVSSETAAVILLSVFVFMISFFFRYKLTIDLLTRNYAEASSVGTSA